MAVHDSSRSARMPSVRGILSPSANSPTSTPSGNVDHKWSGAVECVCLVHAFYSSHKKALPLYSGFRAVLCVCILSQVNTIPVCFESLFSQSLDRCAAELCALYSLLLLQKGGASC